MVEQRRKPINWRSRVVKYGKIKASEITPHPLNPRRHPEIQRQAVRASIDELGLIDVVIININNGYLVDGEERSWEALEQPEDVELDAIWVDLTEEEHNKALMYLDSTAALAQYDAGRVEQLLQDVNSDNVAIQQMLSQLAADAGIAPDFQPVSIDDQSRLDQKQPITCPHCGHEFTPNG